MGDVPDDMAKAATKSAEDVTALAKTLWSEARKHPKAAAAIGIGIGAVAAAVLFTNRKSTKAAPRVPKGITPESD